MTTATAGIPASVGRFPASSDAFAIERVENRLTSPHMTPAPVVAFAGG